MAAFFFLPVHGIAHSLLNHCRRASMYVTGVGLDTRDRIASSPLDSLQPCYMPSKLPRLLTMFLFLSDILLLYLTTPTTLDTCTDLYETRVKRGQPA